MIHIHSLWCSGTKLLKNVLQPDMDQLKNYMNQKFYRIQQPHQYNFKQQAAKIQAHVFKKRTMCVQIYSQGCSYWASLH